MPKPPGWKRFNPPNTRASERATTLAVIERLCNGYLDENTRHTVPMTPYTYLASKGWSGKGVAINAALMHDQLLAMPDAFLTRTPCGSVAYRRVDKPARRARVKAGRHPQQGKDTRS